MKNIEISSETSRGAPAPSSPPLPWPTISGSDFLLAAWAWPEGANPWFLLDDHGKLERVSSRDLGALPFLAKGSSPVAFEVADSPFTYSQHLFYLGQDGRVCDIHRGWANGAPTSTWAVGETWTCPGAPLADTGSPLAGLALRGSLEQRVYYVSADHTLQELLWNGSAWAVKAISAPGSVAVGSGLTALKHGDSPLPSSSSPNLHVYWLGVVDSKPHLFESYVVLTPHSGVFIEGSWIQNDLTAQAGAPCPAAETALSSVALPGVNLVFYVAEDEAIHLIEWQDNQWTDTALPSVPLDPATDLLALHLTVGVALYHVGADQHVHELWRTSGGAWVESDITARAGGPNVLPGTSLRGRSGVATGVNCQTVYYTGADGQVHGLHWSWTAEGGGAWTDTQETSPVNVTLTPKLMKSYRVASPVGSPKDLLTVVNANGHVELMTLRADGTIVNFYPDPTSDTGYRLVDTGLSGSVMAAGVSATGDLVLLAGDGGSLQWVSKPAASTAWSAPQTLSYKAVGSSTMVIEALFAPGNVAPPGGPWPPLSLGAWMHEQDSNDNAGHLYLWEWGSTPSPTVRLDPGSAAWDFEWGWATSATGALMAVGAASASSSIWVISQGVARTLHVSDLCVQSLATKAGSAKIYAVLSDGTVNGLDLGSDNPAWECVAGAQAFPSTKASALRATQDPESRSTHLFVCTEDKVLWHVQHPGDAFAEAGDPAPLLPNVGTFAVGTTPDTFMHAFAAPPYAGALMHLTSTDTISTAEGDWQVSPLEVPVPGAVEEYWSYSCDILLTDSHDAAFVSTKISVASSDVAELLINGQSYTIGPYRSAGVTTNGAGIVSVAFPADRLAAPTLLVSIPSVMTDNESVAVNLHTEVVAKLQDLTGAQLAGAKDASGNLILQPRYQASADAVAQAVSQSVHLGRNLLEASPSVKYLHPLRNKRGVAYFAGDKASLRNIHFPLVEDGHWSIRFEGSGATFAQLTAQQAQARIQEKRTTLKRANGFFDWLEEIGDFIEGILEEVVNVLEIIVSKIGAAVQAVIHFVIEGVEYVFDAIVETVEHAIDLAESVFAQVAIAFEQLAEWLGFLFNWPDILRTQAAVSHTIDVALDLARLGAGAARKALDAKFAALQQEISDKFQGWIQGLQPDDRVGGYVAGSTPYNAGLSDSMSNNIVLNAFLDNASTATGAGAVKLLSFGRSLDNVQSEIAAFANATEKTDSYGPVRGLFQDISGSRDGFFTQALAKLLSLLQALLQAAVAGVQTVLDAVLEAVEDLIGALQSALGEAWNIPLLSDLFAYITNGATLSAQSLLSLIVAIPVTIFYKLVNGAAPFPDDSSVAAFQAQVTAQGLLDLILPPGAALAPAASTAASSWSGSVPLNAAKALSVTASVSAAFTGVLSAMVDTVDGPAPPVLNAVRLGCKGLGLVSSCPYFYKKSPAVFPLVWVFDAVSYGLDIVFVASQTSIPGDVKAVTTSFLGIGRIALGVVQEGQAGFKNPYAIVNDIAGSAPMVAKVLKTKPVYQASGGLSLVLLCAIDIGMGLAVAGLGYASRDLVLSPA